ncbi:FadR/GntR family transcriptional regulator [Sphingomonas alpina]|uniref:FadR family transcriptional regulator n=1 Tax=Sphingomonas alpina TaxID=653931 RepID=A0A7H0LQ19_9SPHN|nr:FCD domain-containing protein [Sphingomonas alpina]QNQ11772.1 FadR family transcriptional regulator [Sphingomonas alpina]
MSDTMIDGGGSLVRRAMDAVNAHIVGQKLRVGDTLPGEGHFAEQLGVSRAVMREAFGALAALRLLDVGNGRRARVGAMDGSVMATSLSHAISTDQVTVPEIWDVRRTLEVRTAALAAANRSAGDAARITELAEAMAGDTVDMADITRYDIEFHDRIARAGRNALFVQIVQSFAPLMQVAVPAAWRTRVSIEHRDLMIERHRAIAVAIADRDPEAAAAAMEAHFDTAVGAVLSELA